MCIKRFSRELPLDESDYTELVNAILQCLSYDPPNLPEINLNWDVNDTTGGSIY